MAYQVVLVLMMCACLLAPGLAATCYGNAFKDRSEFPRCKQLSPKLAMHWMVDGDMLTLGVEGDQVGGWMAVGPSEASGGMPGSDLWVISKDKGTGVFSVSDTYADVFGQPKIDSSQDVELLSVVEGATTTSAKLRRPLRTCDNIGDNRLYANETQIWLWAISSAAWPTIHETPNRGYSSVILQSVVTNAVADTDAEPDASSMMKIEMLMPDVTISKNATTFWCKNFKMPPEKKHVIKIDYNINPNGMIHHISLFGCYSPPNTTNPEYDPVEGLEKDEIYQCAETGTPPTECSAWLLNWFPGQEPLNFPAEAAMAIGKDGWEYLVLQVHYTNPAGKEGLKDSTGLVLYHTSELRPNDMGMLWIGTTDIAVPPKEKHYTIFPGICPSECTQKFKQPVKLTWHSPHMHQIGASFQTPHLRMNPDGSLREIAPLGVRNHYEYYFQGTSYVFPESNVLLPGDALISNCSYSSLKRDNVTFWGIESTSEMCYNFVNYYPKQDIELCMPYPGVNKLGTKDIGYSYCSTAFGRAEFENALNAVPEPVGGRNFTEQQFYAWADKNLLPVFEAYTKKGVLVEFNITKHLQYAQQQLGTLQCTKQDNSKLKFSVEGAKSVNNSNVNTSNGGVATGVVMGWNVLLGVVFLALLG